jgi:hypothetical protein
VDLFSRGDIRSPEIDETPYLLGRVHPHTAEDKGAVRIGSNLIAYATLCSVLSCRRPIVGSAQVAPMFARGDQSLALSFHVAKK